MAQPDLPSQPKRGHRRRTPETWAAARADYASGLLRERGVRAA